MNSPISDFVNDYVCNNPIRMHMPGHKGRLFCSSLNEDSWIRQAMKYDITEIDGADYLSAPCGIIAESEANAGRLFGCRTYYSTEGSSLCIRAMMFLVKKHALLKGHEPLVLAGRNAHASLVNACAVLDMDVEWIMQKESDSYESCRINGGELEEILKEHGESGVSSNCSDGNCGRMPDALYVTSPDYLGNMLDVEELAKVCHRYGVLLLVDNAHGAYFKFLEKSIHPMDLGADMCCDSAHKMLPVLTGGAYLHVAYPKSDFEITMGEECKGNANILTVREFLAENARQALSIFATTSPSYLILQSLDLCNVFLDGNTIISKIADKVSALRKDLLENGYRLIGDEPLKVTLWFHGKGSASGVSGRLANYLMEKGIYVEYHDDEHMVMMFSGNTQDFEFETVRDVLRSFAKENMPLPAGMIDESKSDANGDGRKPAPVKVMSFKDAMMSLSEYVDVEESVGRVLAQPVLNCPPCVPIYMCGEVIGEDIKKFCSGRVSVVIGT